LNDERSMVVLGAVVGAALGAMADYLFLTERGRQLRRSVEPLLGSVVNDVANL
jgi:gas vesicle protein